MLSRNCVSQDQQREMNGDDFMRFYPEGLIVLHFEKIEQPRNFLPLYFQFFAVLSTIALTKIYQGTNERIAMRHLTNPPKISAYTRKTRGAGIGNVHGSSSFCAPFFEACALSSARSPRTTLSFCFQPLTRSPGRRSSNASPGRGAP